MTFFNPYPDLESFVGQLMLQLFIIIGLPKVVHKVLIRFGQPLVVSEIISGIILGPTILGQIPNFTNKIFPTTSLSGLQTIAQLALVLFLLLVGLNLDPKKIYKNSRMCITYSFVGMLVPTIMGIPLSYLVTGSQFTNAKQYIVVLLIGVIFSISALSLLARILGEIGFLHSDLGTMTMCTTAFDTCFCWIYLAIVIALNNNSKDPLIKYSGLWIILATIVHAGLLWYIVRPLLRLITKHVNRKGQLEPMPFFLIVFIALGAAYVTEEIGISGLFGAFEVGLLVPRKGPTPGFVRERLNDAVVIVLLPVYMTYSGLRTDLTLLDKGSYWGIAFLFVVAAFASKGLSLMFLGKLFKLGWYDAFGLGLLLSCKGLVALAMLNTALDNKLITQEFFAMFVVYSLVATLMTTPLLKTVQRLKKRKEKKEATAHDTYNIMVLPRTPYYGPLTVSLAYCLSKRTNVRTKLRSRVTVARIKDLDDEVGMNSKKYMKQDHILGPCLQQAAFFNLDISLKFIITNEPAEEIITVANQELEDTLIFGFDKTLATEDILRAVFKRASANIGVYYGNKGISQLGGRILLPYSGTDHDKLAVKWTKRIINTFPHQVIVLLINQPSEDIYFLHDDSPYAFPNVYVVSREGDKMKAIIDELKANTAINLLVAGEINEHDFDNEIDLLHSFTHIHCPFLLCSSKRDRAQFYTESSTSDKISLSHETELKSMTTETMATHNIEIEKQV